MKRRRNASTADQAPTKTPSTSPTTRSSRRIAAPLRADGTDSPPAFPTCELTTLRVPSTPSRRKAGTGILNGVHPEPVVSPSPRKDLLMTPQKVRFTSAESPPSIVTNADKSARRKSVRRMVAKTLDGGDGTDDDEEDDELVGKIYSDSEEGSGSEEDEDPEVPTSNPTKAARGKTTTAKQPVKAKGRKKRESTPPPSFLDGVESYFHQNKKIRQQTSTATLSSLPQLDHTTYFSLLRSYPDHHADVRMRLFSLHLENMPQWKFELSQGFNLLFYGYGSKRALLTAIASALYTTTGSVAIINGYLPILALKDILNIISSAILASSSSSSSSAAPKLGATPTDMTDNLLSLLNEPNAQPIVLIIHNLDGESLRAERAQAILARIAAHPKISLVASIDHIRAPLLWDAARKEQFNFLWHDATTFEPYSVEIPADEALALVDGAGRVGGTKGVKYVLASLPTNAKALFRVLISEQLQTMEDEGVTEKRNPEDYGMEYRVLYQKAVAEFICSNDVAFRSLLKEFMDHQMVNTKKDGQGTELLWAPFRKEDLEEILDGLL